MQKLKAKLVSTYTKNGVTRNVHALSGTPEAIAQYIADQANVVKGDGTKGATLNEAGQPLYFSRTIVEEISRSEKLMSWFPDRELDKQITQEIESLRKSGNEGLANTLEKAQADAYIARIKASISAKVSKPAVVETAVAGGLDNA